MLALVMAACMALSLAACGGNTSTRRVPPRRAIPPGFRQHHRRFRRDRADRTQPETIDPALNSAIDGANMLITFFEPLLIVDENNTVQPGQAESYDVSEDGLPGPSTCVTA